MTTDETGQGMLFSGLPDAPKAPEPSDVFRGQVSGLVERAQAAMLGRREREAAEAEEAARMAELDAAAAMAPDEPKPASTGNTASEAPPPGDNVILLQREPRKAMPKTAAKHPKGEAEQGGGKGESGEFFKIDRTIWHRVCALGLNPAVAYFVLARGTGGDNRTTSWSVNAIEKWTSISRAQAAKAIKDLIAAGFVRQIKGGTWPQYSLMAADEMNAAVELTRPEQTVFDMVAYGASEENEQDAVWVPKISQPGWGVSNPYAIACNLVRRGVLIHKSGQSFSLAPVGASPDWVWLPNALVSSADGETPPLELVRQSLSVELLGLFVDLYAAHGLSSNGGLDWRVETGIARHFERVKVGERGAWAVWGWKPGSYTVEGSRPPGWDKFRGRLESNAADSQAFFGALRELERVGLLEYVAHLVEDPAHPASQIIHPIPYGNGEPWEREVAAAAKAAAERLATPERVASANKAGCRIYAPVEARRGNAGVVGVLRLRYKPKTSATAIWVKQAEVWRAMAARYDSLDAGGHISEDSALQHKGR